MKEPQWHQASLFGRPQKIDSPAHEWSMDAAKHTRMDFEDHVRTQLRGIDVQVTW